MSLKTTISRNGLYLLVVAILTSGIYGICDYYLHSVAKELMLNWADTEAIAIEEGNLLTSITKTQRFLISSSYIKGVRLIKVENDSLSSKIEFGSPFDLSPEDFSDLPQELTQRRIGFLHQRAFYKIPKKDNMILVFDVHSKFLVLLFGISSSLIVLLVVYLIWALQKLEQKETKKRTELLKIAINDLLLKDHPSKILENEIPDLVKWWNIKRNEINESRMIAIEQQSKILLGEIASRSVHDIKGALRNVREISKMAAGLSAPQKSIIEKSLDKISKISQSLLDETKSIHAEENALRKDTDLVNVLKETIQLKQTQYGSTVQIYFTSKISELQSVLDSSQLERSISNLIDNAVEASQNGSAVRVTLSYQDNNAFIQITDSGIGISTENLQKIGIKGFTDGKDHGTGLGVFYAKRFVEDLGGRFEIQSELNKGTTITLIMPATAKNTSAVISVSPTEHLLVLEDQAYIRATVKLKFKDAGLSEESYSIFSTPSELEQWLATHDLNFKLYSDYFLETENGEKLETGLQVIKRLGLTDKAVLFTSAFDNPDVANAANEVGVPVLSKEQFFKAEIKSGV